MFTNLEEMTRARDEAIHTGNAIVSTAFEGVRRLTEVNVRTARGSMEQSSGSLRNLMNTPDPKAAADTAKAAVSDGARQQEGMAVDYIREIFAITNETAGSIRSLVDRQLSSSQQSMLQSLEGMARNAPAGSQAWVSLFRQGVDQANAAYAQLNDQARQMTEIVQANVLGATDAAAATGRRTATAATGAATAN